MDYIYVIIKSGVYDHGCHGVFTDKDKAIKSCDECAHLEEDDYHTFSVYEIPLNTLPTQEEIQYEGFSYILYYRTKNVIKTTPIKLTNYKQIIDEG